MDREKHTYDKCEAEIHGYKKSDLHEYEAKTVQKTKISRD